MNRIASMFTAGVTSGLSAAAIAAAAMAQGVFSGSSGEPQDPGTSATEQVASGGPPVAPVLQVAASQPEALASQPQASNGGVSQHDVGDDHGGDRDRDDDRSGRGGHDDDDRDDDDDDHSGRDRSGHDDD